ASGPPCRRPTQPGAFRCGLGAAAAQRLDPCHAAGNGEHPFANRGSDVLSLESVRAWLAAYAPDLPIIEVEESTATVDLAAQALGVEPGRIAKTLAIRVKDEVLLLVTRGDARLDNVKCKAAFGGRPRMLGPEETLALTGHPVGGVCPFGLATPLPIRCDVSLRDFDI